MTTLQTRRGTKFRTETRRRFVLVGEAVQPGRDGTWPKPWIHKRSDSRATLEKELERIAWRFTSNTFEIIDTRPDPDPEVLRAASRERNLAARAARQRAHGLIG